MGGAAHAPAAKPHQYAQIREIGEWISDSRIHGERRWDDRLKTLYTVTNRHSPVMGISCAMSFVTWEE